ncbi:MAG TPA: DinB family protein [Alloacidobacterium sp.]|jgi:uncharacterized damage-inducible protein DinB|nr:DinB family protein [Alloacidobacterium sp.]
MKAIRIFCIAMLCCLMAPATMLHAQAVGTQAAPADVYGKLMGMMEKQIVAAADAMPADKFDFAPTQGEFKGVRTFGQQVKHLAESNYDFFEGWNVPGAVKEADIEKLTSKDDIMKALRDSYTFAHAAIGTITAANAFTVMGSGERKYTRAGLASFCIAHSMDHYGQMVVYLRMNGIVPPASRQGGM